MFIQHSILTHGYVADPNDPTVPYSTQRHYILYLMREGMKATGDTADPVVELNIYAAECFDFGRMYPGLNVYYGGKYEQATSEQTQ